MYGVTQLAKMYGTTRQTVYNKLEDSRLKEFVIDKDGKKLILDGLNMFNVVMAEGRVRPPKDTEKDEPVTTKLDEMTQKYIAELERQITVLTGDKEKLFFELSEQRKIFLLESGEKQNKKWWQNIFN